MKKSLILLIFLSSTCLAQETPVDRLGAALDSVGFSRGDLGFHPKGYWTRFPQPSGIPYTMPFFADLFAEPLRVIDYTQAMGNAVRQYLDPAFYDTTEITLHRLTYILGVDRMMTGFRNYSVNLAPRIDSTRPMLDAIEQVYQGEGRQLNFMTFGNQSDWPNYGKELQAAADSLPKELQLIAAELILNIYDAYKWRKIAIRNVNTDDALALYKMKNLAESMGGGQIYYPEIDDVAKEFGKGRLEYIRLADNGVPNILDGDINMGITAADPIEKSYQLFEIHQSLFDLANPREELRYSGAVTWDGFISTIFFYQTHNGIKVENGHYAVHFNRDGTLNGANGNLFPEARQVNTTPTISAERAQEIAEANYTGLKIDFSGLEEFGVKEAEPGLIIHGRKGKFYLCWRVSPGVEYNYFIDAHSGEIVDKVPALIKD